MESNFDQFNPWQFANRRKVGEIEMGRYSFCFFVFASLIISNAFADNKIYVSTKDIMIADNGIFVKIDGYVFKTKSIFHDNIGTFFIDFETVKCPECGREYPAYEKECPYGGAHENDEKENSNQSKL